MPDLDEVQNKILSEAKLLEQRRVELTAKAIEQRVWDLLPRPWQGITEAEEEIGPAFVEVTFHTGLVPEDSERFTERECRNFIRFVGSVADEIRKEQR